MGSVGTRDDRQVSADFFWREACGLVVAEAANAKGEGCPIVGFDLTNLGESKWTELKSLSS